MRVVMRVVAIMRVRVRVIMRAIAIVVAIAIVIVVIKFISVLMWLVSITPGHVKLDWLPPPKVDRVNDNLAHYQH